MLIRDHGHKPVSKYANHNAFARKPTLVVYIVTTNVCSQSMCKEKLNQTLKVPTVKPP
jgi:hypothetical protein